MFQETKLSANDKKWIEIMDISYMSSEESEGENSIVVHPLPWLTDEVNSFKKSLDDARHAAMTPQAKRQLKTRVTGEVSSRDRPNGSGWMFTD